MNRIPCTKPGCVGIMVVISRDIIKRSTIYKCPVCNKTETLGGETLM